MEAGEIWDAWHFWRSIPRNVFPAIETRRIGQRGIIAFKLGRAQEAEQALRTAIERFRELEMPFDAAVFQLYLADLLLTVGRLWECGHIIAQALDLFQSCQLRSHMVVALEQLEAALKQERGLPQAIERAIARASGIVRRHDEGTD